MTRVSLYCRISRDREGAGLGVATQEKDCRDLAASLGWSIVAVHTDNDLSAYSGKPRPGYRALLASIRDDETDAVIAWHTDRLHRSPIELEEYAEACEKHQVKTQTVKAGHLDLGTASGLMVARMLGVTARYEVDHSIERQRRAKQRSAEAGKWKGGRRPFGFERDGVTLRENEATAIAEASADLLRGVSLSSIARSWNAAGLVGSMGSTQSPNTVRAVLLRPRNAGLMEHRGEVVGSAQWPAIVTETEWRAVVHTLRNPDRRSNVGASGRRWLGSGIYRCECGSTVICSTSNASHAYRCRDGCGRLSRKQRDVDALIEKVVVERLRQPDVSDLLARDDSARRDTLEAETRALRTRLDSLASVFAEGAIDARQLAEGSRELRARLDDAQQQLASLFAGTAFEGVADAEDPGAAWLDASLDRRRTVLNALMSVTLLRGALGRPPGWKPGDPYFRPEKVRIEWRDET